MDGVSQNISNDILLLGALTSLRRSEEQIEAHQHIIEEASESATSPAENVEENQTKVDVIA